MLVLSRKPGEKVHIGSNIVITLIEMQGNRVRLGIEAPLDVPILRSELLDLLSRIGTERIDASTPTSHELAPVS